MYNLLFYFIDNNLLIFLNKDKRYLLYILILLGLYNIIYS